jgi:CTP:molybdopterin cytidylyltransferase MocA
MTVAAVILSATSEGALVPTLGQARVRRLVDIAWSGGALPVVVVAPDESGAVARALVGSEAVHAAPAPDALGPAGQMVRGAEMALTEVHETGAVLLWPARMTWVGPESITSLIEAHGVDRTTILRPAWQGQPGWPVLLPVDALPALRTVDPRLMPDEVVAALEQQVPARVVEVGDPGVVHDATVAYADLPPYDGPPDPPAGHTHEWGDGVEEDGVDEDVPGEGRGLAPYPQAADDVALDLD